MLRRVLASIVVLAFAGALGFGGQAGQRPLNPPAGGASTAGVFEPVKDARARPITAGGFVDGAPVVFEDRTAGSGLESFRHRSGSPEKSIILDAPSGGVALVDVDNDGWLDVYLVNGSTRAALNGAEPAPRAALFHNDRNLKFTDITSRAGVANERWGFGVAAGDFDNDGWMDLYVTNFRGNRLYRNNHDGTFTDVAERMGVAAGDFSTGASFGDYDKDGRLDLFIAGYVAIDPERPPMPASAQASPDASEKDRAASQTRGLLSCAYRGEPVMCGPRGLQGSADRLFRNAGDRFVDVTAQAGVADTAGYFGFASAWVDVDDDGDLDLMVVNDSTPNYLYRNTGKGAFEEVGFPAGFALNEEGREQAGMGLAIGDYDNDGRVDTYITNFSDDSNTLRRNLGDGTFADVTGTLGLRMPTLPFLGWGTGFLDFDNDGWLDVFVANGHVYPEVDKFDWGMTWAQRPLLFRNLEGRRFQEVPPATGSGLAAVLPARGAAFGDLDNDGRIDVVINNQDRGPTLLRNVAPGGHWIEVSLNGGTRGQRDAIGAVVTLEAGPRRLRRDVVSGASYCSQSDLRVHFGLGETTAVDRLVVRWPDGAREAFKVPGVDRILSLTKGQGAAHEP
jgi:enediyne biosynthesis protein E4